MWKLHILFVMQISVKLATSTTLCSPINRVSQPSRCLEAIKELSESTSQFWFGTAYSTRCSGQKIYTLECINPRSGIADSILSRLGISSNLEFFVDVTFQSNAGSYVSCGNQYTMSTSMNIDLDPTSSEQVTPWETIIAPTISWEARSGTYTVVILSVGAPINHGIYINIPGNRFADAEVFKAYHGPIHFFTSFAQVYAVLVFKQQDDNLVIPADWVANLGSPGFMQYDVPSMMIALNLTGPVAMNWMNVIGDPYAVQEYINSRTLFMCPYLIQNEIKSHNRPFIPADPAFNVYLDVTFSPSPMMFTSCCSQYLYPGKMLTLNPLGDKIVKAGEVRSSAIPTVQFTIGGLYFTRYNFTGKMYTLICVHPDDIIPSRGTQDRPTLHWQVINIVDGDLSTGQVTMPYAGPMPGDSRSHYYYFLLYEQEKELSSSNLLVYTNPPGGRFLFNISGFVNNNQLTLVGATWMVTTQDEYTRYNYVTNQGRNEAEICNGVQGYGSPCPTSKATTNSTRLSVIFSFMCTFIFISLSVL